MGKFVVRTVNTGIKFDLKATNGQVIATSEVYESKAACLNGVESVRKNAAVAGVEDQTVEGYATVTHPKFEMYADKGGATARSSPSPKAIPPRHPVPTASKASRRTPPKLRLRKFNCIP